MRYLSVAAGLLLLASNVSRADDAGIAGLGGRSCGEFAKDYQGNLTYEQAYFSWGEGYMSGLNVALAAGNKPQKDLNAVPINDQLGFVRRYCIENALAPYVAGVGKLYDSFPRKSAR